MARHRRRRPRRRTRASWSSPATDRDRPLSSLRDAPSHRLPETLAGAGRRRAAGRTRGALPRPATGRSSPPRRLDAWGRAGVLEPSAASALREVAAHPEWLRLEGRTVAVLGAGAEMGPLGPLLRWGATVAAVDLPTPAIWERVLGTARAGAGRLLVPVAPGTRDAGARPAGRGAGDRRVAGRARRQPRPRQLPLRRRRHARPGLGCRRRTRLAASSARGPTPRSPSWPPPPTRSWSRTTRSSTPTGPTRSGRAWRSCVGRPLRWASRGRLLHRQYSPGADLGIADCLVAATRSQLRPGQAHPALACVRRSRRGPQVSFHVAPSTRTRSVVKNRALAAAFAGAHRFGVEVFDPSTSNTLMAALLVHDLMSEPVSPRTSLAGRGVRRRARRSVARAVRAAQRPGAGRRARVRQRPRLATQKASVLLDHYLAVADDIERVALPDVDEGARRQVQPL